MNVPYIYQSSWPFVCQKLLKLVLTVFLRHVVDLLLTVTITANVLVSGLSANKKGRINKFFCNFWLQCTFQDQIATKWMEIG